MKKTTRSASRAPFTSSFPSSTTNTTIATNAATAGPAAIGTTTTTSTTRKKLGLWLTLSFALGFAISTILWSHVYILFGSTTTSSQQLQHPTIILHDSSSSRSSSSNGGDKSRQGQTAPQQPQTQQIQTQTDAHDQPHQGLSSCSMLQLDSSSSSFLWNQHLEQLFWASRHPQDTEQEYKWHDFTARLLQYMSPAQMQLSAKVLPSRYWDQVGNALDVVYKRYEYVRLVKQEYRHGMSAAKEDKDKEEEEPRKLRIWVMGGSVTMGVQCHANPVEETSRFSRRSCAWPARLGHFLNAILGGDVVQVDVITLGGTNTESAIRIWDYSLFPEDMLPYPDIVIHGYATNDMHVLSEQEARKRGVSLEEMILQINQQFVRMVLKPPLDDCNDRPVPLLLYYDDYVGNEQREIVQTGAFARAAHGLATYYGFGLISYADVVRHWVYGDTNETWFSPSDWPNRQVHPGMGMHISSMWIVAYNLLHMASVYCSDRRIAGHDWSEYTPGQGFPELREKYKVLAGEPRRTPSVLPPGLDKLTSLDDISSRWKLLSLSMDQNRSNVDVNAFMCKSAPPQQVMGKPCVFSWVSGLERKMDKISHLDARMRSVLISNHGWASTMEVKGKLGFQAIKGVGSVFEMKVRAKVLKIQTLNFMVMKSYGMKWKDSRVRVEAFVDRYKQQQLPEQNLSMNPVKTMDIQGFHDRQTSETYNYKIDLEGDHALPRDVVRIRVTLQSGSTFKFMGMAFCDH